MIENLCLQRQTAQLTSKQKTKPSQSSWSACHLYGNFGENFPLNGTSIFFGTERTGTGLSCTIYKTSVNFSLSLDMMSAHALRMSPFLAWGDFHARSRFVRPILSLRKNGGLLVVCTRFHYSRTPVTPTRKGNEKKFEKQPD